MSRLSTSISMMRAAVTTTVSSLMAINTLSVHIPLLKDTSTPKERDDDGIQYND